MGDTGTPYDKAIEESAKAASNAVDLIREGGRAIGPAIADVYGLLIGDRVRSARVRNLEEINAKRQKRLDERGVKETVLLPEDIAIPILEAAQGETRDDLQDLWARLLANAMDPARTNDVRPEFIVTTRQLQPIDAVILEFVNRGSGKNITQQDIIENTLRRPYAIVISLEHLSNLNCLKPNTGGNYYALTPYGRELMIALSP
jgi:hypothetical protein